MSDPHDSDVQQVDHTGEASICGAIRLSAQCESVQAYAQADWLEPNMVTGLATAQALQHAIYKGKWARILTHPLEPAATPAAGE